MVKNHKKEQLQETVHSSVLTGCFTFVHVVFQLVSGGLLLVLSCLLCSCWLTVCIVVVVLCVLLSYVYLLYYVCIAVFT